MIKKIFEKLKKKKSFFSIKNKRIKYEEKLLKDYEKGKILQVDNNIDNKVYLEGLNNE